jgi:3-hydroxyacyl-[acyl-carrier-protein] dehydratase
MSQAQPLPVVPATANRHAEEKLERLPAGALENYRTFLKSGAEQALAGLVLEALNYFQPKTFAAISGRELPDGTRLIEDLGFDSLATIETVFFFEDLFQISVSNDEIMTVRTVGDLRRFLQGKLAAGKA